jgi:cellulose biosynthesis protein BcsQ
MAYVIAMSNEKGGVAKTTSTLSLGAALAELNYRVLLIDLDPQANLSLALGLETEETTITSANVLIEGARSRPPSENRRSQSRHRSLEFSHRERRAVPAHAQPVPHHASRRARGCLPPA